VRFVEVWRCCLGTEPQVCRRRVSLCSRSWRAGHLLSKVAVSPSRQLCARPSPRAEGPELGRAHDSSDPVTGTPGSARRNGLTDARQVRRRVRHPDDVASDQRFPAAGSYSLISPPRTGRRRILPWIGRGQVPAGGVNADAALDAAAFGCTAANTPRWRPGCAGLRTRGRARHSRAVATTPSPLSRLRRGWRSREGLGEQPLVAVAGLVHGPAWAATKP
jgi:hypothetical protein